MENVKEEFPKMLLAHEDAMRAVKRTLYEGAFKQYYETYVPLFETISKEYLECENKEAYLAQICDEFALKASEKLNTTKKNKREMAQFDMNFMMVTYVFPAIMEYKDEMSEPLAKTLQGKWNQTFAKTKIEISTYQDIKGGFKTKLCYVTTAVCESLGKDMQCYELTLLKNYRDQVLAKEEDGARLIDEYYDIAPTIVNRINKCPERDEIYASIFQEYIRPCITYIENERTDLCKSTYCTMMQQLKKDYMGYKSEN